MMLLFSILNSDAQIMAESVFSFVLSIKLADTDTGYWFV